MSDKYTIEITKTDADPSTPWLAAVYDEHDQEADGVWEDLRLYGYGSTAAAAAKAAVDGWLETR